MSLSTPDKEFYHLTVSINKALNLMEAPLKIKHARSAIITTHRTKEAKSFWAVIMRQPLMENRFTAWKFCHLLHKVLREGHVSAIKHSQTHKKMILEMGKLWGHLHDGVGNCIQAYSKLIVTKLEFHEKNALFPGSLLIEFRDIEKFAGDDINVYFQLCVEIFDYLDDIIEVQMRVFSSINTYRMSSMTPQGQCRLAPLITLIQDSNPLYDICVRVMFKLHDELPNDILLGHRDRFRDMFIKLKHFYDNVRPLQYFADLIQVPHLPESAPNFTSKVDFGSYVPPVVYVPEPEHVVDNLVEMSIMEEPPVQPPPPMQSNEIIALENTIRSRENVIGELQNQLSNAREAFNTIQNKYRSDVIQLREEMTALNNELASARESCSNMKSLNSDLELKLMQTPTLMEKATHEEEKAKASEEKFAKVINMYSQMREEHINLLRQHSETTKLMNKHKNESSELKLEIEKLREHVTHIEEESKMKDIVSSLNSDLELKLEEMKTKCEQAITEQKSQSRVHEEAIIFKSKEIDQLTEKINHLEANVEVLEKYKSKTNILEKTLKDAHDEYRNKIDEQEAIINTYKTDLDSTRNDISELERVRGVEIELKEIRNSELQLKLEEMRVKYDEAVTANEAQKQEHKEHDIFQSGEIEQLTEKIHQLEVNVEELEQYKSKAITLEQNLNEAQDEYCKKNHEHETILNNYKTDLESRLNENSELKRIHKEEIELKESQIYRIEESLSIANMHLKERDLALSRLTEEKLLLENELHDMLHHNSETENKLKAAVMESNAIASAKLDGEIRYESIIASLLHCVLKTLEFISASKFNESNEQNFEKALKFLDEMEKLLNELSVVYQKYGEEKNSVEGLARKSILLCYSSTMLHEQCISIYNTTTNIEKGQEIYNKIISFGQPLISLFQLLHNAGEAVNVENCVVTVKTKLSELKKLIEDIVISSNKNVELVDLVEKELEEMDKAIEEAALRFVEMLSKARSEDDGIKLEVNEKILDACTKLMKCIKLLIQKSKILQEEIVSTGRGSTSVKEFYKRNSQWTEGLISASKSVAKGANLLVEAANKAVTSESNQNFEIIVAAQEIAACTAQLVIASKVKSPGQSPKLLDLTKASRNVSEATGAVVATVKDCNQHLEQSQEIDLTNLTASQAKTMEMDIHVRVLQLEQALETERFKLATFRRKNYHNTED